MVLNVKKSFLLSAIKEMIFKILKLFITFEYLSFFLK